MSMRPFDLTAVIEATEARDAAAEQLRLANEEGDADGILFWKAKVAKADRDIFRAGGPLP